MAILVQNLVFGIKRKKSNQFFSMSESARNWINNFDASIRTQLEMEFYFFLFKVVYFDLQNPNLMSIPITRKLKPLLCIM